MQYDSGLDSIEIHAIENEIISGISSAQKASAASTVSSTAINARDSATISAEALQLAASITPSIEDQEYDDMFHESIALQGGLIGPGGAMINIGPIDDPTYAVIKNETITISGMDLYSYQAAYQLRQETARMLEYVMMLTQNVKIEEGQSLQEKLMNMVNSLANVMAEQVGDPNYTQDAESLEEAFRNITTVLITDVARVEQSQLPDNDNMIMEARSMADMFNNLFFESLKNNDAKKSFDTAWSVL